MPSRRELLVLGMLATGVPVALAQGFKMDRVEVHSDDEIDYSAFKTFGWKDAVRPAERQQTHMSIIWYVERGLEKKGLKKIQDDDPEVPDVFVRYWAKGKSKIEGTPVSTRDLLPGGPENLTTSFDFRKASAGTLILELQTPDNTAVWRAGSNFSIDNKRIDAEVKRAVGILLSRYPPK